MGHARLSTCATQVFLYALQALWYVGYNTTLCQSLELNNFQIKFVVINLTDKVIQQIYRSANLCTKCCLCVLRCLLCSHFLILHSTELLQSHIDVLVMLLYAFHRLLFCGCLKIFQRIKHRQFFGGFRYQEEHLSEIRLEENKRVTRQGYTFYRALLSASTTSQRQFFYSVILSTICLV